MVVNGVDEAKIQQRLIVGCNVNKRFKWRLEVSQTQGLSDTFDAEVYMR